MSLIAVTGASGAIGLHLLRRLLGSPDVTVRALVHESPAAALPQSERLHCVRGDLADSSSLRALLEPGCILVNLAYSRSWPLQKHLAATTDFVNLAAETRVRRVLHCSTAAVVGRAAARRITETTVPVPKNHYEITKLAIENAWLKPDGLELAILRPTAVYGPGAQYLIKLAGELHSGEGLTNYARSSIFGRRHMHCVNVGNVVAAIEHLINTPVPQIRETYIVSDDEEPANNFHDVERLLMRAWGMRYYPVPPLPVPKVVLSALLRLKGRTNYDPDRIYDASKLERAGLQKPYPLERGLREFAAWYAATAAGTVSGTT